MLHLRQFGENPTESLNVLRGGMPDRQSYHQFPDVDRNVRGLQQKAEHRGVVRWMRVFVATLHSQRAKKDALTGLAKFGCHQSTRFQRSDVIYFAQDDFLGDHHGGEEQEAKPRNHIIVAIDMMNDRGTATSQGKGKTQEKKRKEKAGKRGSVLCAGAGVIGMGI
jgi:hypothetical protein